MTHRITTDDDVSVLTTFESHGVLCVVDSQGGTWSSDDDAVNAEIWASDDPSATAIRICENEPRRGSWMD